MLLKNCDTRKFQARQSTDHEIIATSVSNDLHANRVYEVDDQFGLDPIEEKGWVAGQQGLLKLAAVSSSHCKKNNPVFGGVVLKFTAQKSNFVSGLRLHGERSVNIVTSALREAFPNTQKLLVVAGVVNKVIASLPSPEVVGFKALDLSKCFVGLLVEPCRLQDEYESVRAAVTAAINDVHTVVLQIGTDAPGKFDLSKFDSLVNNEYMRGADADAVLLSTAKYGSKRVTPTTSFFDRDCWSSVIVTAPIICKNTKVYWGCCAEANVFPQRLC